MSSLSSIRHSTSAPNLSKEYIASTAPYPDDAREVETTECRVPITIEHLRRLAQIALASMDSFGEKRPRLAKHRFCIVLGQEAADHYLNGTGFRCISVYTFFKRSKECRNFHPLRHTRVDFGTSEFGHSSWIKHPRDKGFVGRGVNCFGRSVLFNKGDTYKTALQRYLAESNTQGVQTLRDHAVVVIWPEKHLGEVITQH